MRSGVRRRSVIAARVLYAGSYVDIAPSFVFPTVTYVDRDARAKALEFKRVARMWVLPSIFASWFLHQLLMTDIALYGDINNRWHDALEHRGE